MAYPHPMDDKTGFEATDEEMGLTPPSDLIQTPEELSEARRVEILRLAVINMQMLKALQDYIALVENVAKTKRLPDSALKANRAAMRAAIAKATGGA